MSETDLMTSSSGHHHGSDGGSLTPSQRREILSLVWILPPSSSSLSLHGEQWKWRCFITFCLNRCCFESCLTCSCRDSLWLHLPPNVRVRLITSADFGLFWRGKIFPLILKIIKNVYIYIFIFFIYISGASVVCSLKQLIILIMLLDH